MKWLMILISMMPVLNRPASLNTWAVAKESSVDIKGSSNVNSFVFTSKDYSGKDTMVISQKNKHQRYTFEKGLLYLPVNNFRNSNPVLSRDFKKMLQAKQYPYILMNFRSITGLQSQAEAEVDIQIAGKTRTKCIKLVSTQKNNLMYFQGCEQLKFTEFGLKPPKKVLGFIDVKDEVEVEFNLVMKMVK